MTFNPKHVAQVVEAYAVQERRETPSVPVAAPAAEQNWIDVEVARLCRETNTFSMGRALRAEAECFVIWARGNAWASAESRRAELRTEGKKLKAAIDADVARGLMHASWTTGRLLDFIFSARETPFTFGEEVTLAARRELGL